MIEFAVVKTSPSANESKQSNPKVASGTQSDDEHGASFDAEYAASDGKKPDDAKAAKTADAQSQLDAEEPKSNSDMPEEEDPQAFSVSDAAAPPKNDEVSELAGIVDGEAVQNDGKALRKEGLAPEKQIEAKRAIPASDAANTSDTRNTASKGLEPGWSGSGSAARGDETPADVLKTVPDPSQKTAAPAKTTPAELLAMSKVTDVTQKPGNSGSATAGREGPVVKDMTARAQVARNGGTLAVADMPKAASQAEEAVAEARIRRETRFESQEAVTGDKPKPKVNSVQPVAAQMMAASQVLQLSVINEKSETLSLIAESFEPLGASEPRTVSSTPVAGLAAILNRADTPTMIARQMAEALQKASDKPIEIALNPKELGRVRMSISPAESGITVNVMAERPETLDLMRRNIEQLAREFVELGYTNMEFAFAQGESNAGTSDSESFSDTSEIDVLALEAEPARDQPGPHLAPTSGLDLRL